MGHQPQVSLRRGLSLRSQPAKGGTRSNRHCHTVLCLSVWGAGEGLGALRRLDPFITERLPLPRLWRSSGTRRA